MFCYHKKRGLMAFGPTHSCPQVVGVRHSRPGSVRMRMRSKAAHGLTLITFNFGRVGIYTTQISLSHFMWD